MNNIMNLKEENDDHHHYVLLEEDGAEEKHRHLAVEGNHDQKYRKVELYDANGTCKLQDAISSYGDSFDLSLQGTPSEATEAATGIMFSIQAKSNLEVLSFEFVSFDNGQDSTNNQEVEIYTMDGNDFQSAVNQRNKWTLFGKAIAIQDSEDSKLKIVPRGGSNMELHAIPIPEGQERSFYITLKLKKLSVYTNQGDTGKAFISDDMVDVNVGLALQGSGFQGSGTPNRAFHGVVHYNSIQGCAEDLSTSTRVSMSFAISKAATENDVRVILGESIPNIMLFNPKLKQMINLHNLSWMENNIELPQTGREEREDCSEFGSMDFQDGCAVYEAILQYQHYESLTSELLKFELINAFGSVKSGFTFQELSDFEVYYAGDSIQRQKYNIVLNGLSGSTYLNPLQRSYIQDVTQLFFQDDTLTANSEEGSNDFFMPSKIDIIGQVFDSSTSRRRTLLRGSSRDRYLQEDMVVVESSIAGIGENEDEYFKSIENTFSKHADLYKDLLINQQYRPHQINDGFQDFGSIFTSLVSVSVMRPEDTPDGTSIYDVSLEDGLSKEEIQIIICSILLFLSTCFFGYLIYADCFRVQKRDKIIAKKLERDDTSSKLRPGPMTESEREKALGNMDLFPKHAFDEAKEQAREKQTKRRSEMPNPQKSFAVGRGRSRSPTRGVGISKSFSGELAGMRKSLKSEQAPRGRSRSPSAPDNRRGRSRSPGAPTRRGRSASPSAAKGGGRGRSFSPSGRRGSSHSSTSGQPSFRRPSKSSLDDSGRGLRDQSQMSFVMPSKSSVASQQESGSSHSRNGSSHSRSFRVPSKSSVESGSFHERTSFNRKENPRRSNTFGDMSPIREQGSSGGRPAPPRRRKSADDLGVFFATQNSTTKPKRPSGASKSLGDPSLQRMPPQPPPPVRNKSGEVSHSSGKSRRSSKSGKSKSSSKKSRKSSVSGKKKSKALPVISGNETGVTTSNHTASTSGSSKASRKGKNGSDKPKRSKSSDDASELSDKKKKKKKKVPPRKATSDAGMLPPGSPTPFVSKSSGKAAPPPVRVGMVGAEQRR